MMDAADAALVMDAGVFRIVSVVYATREVVGVVGVVLTGGTVRVHGRGGYGSRVLILSAMRASFSCVFWGFCLR